MTQPNRFSAAKIFSIAYALPENTRLYAVGDVHGRADLLENLLEQIKADWVARPIARPVLVMLGDYVDRGPDSFAVLERLASLSWPGWQMIFLRGNHEQRMLDFLESPEHAGDWYRFGGLETLASYGVRAEMGPAGWRRSATAFQAAIPAKQWDFLKNLTTYFALGSILCVHAGLRRGIAVSEQGEDVLLWIREPFLSDITEDGFLVVHGHTIQRLPQIRANRIGIDTGAYATGILTAFVLEENWGFFLQTG